MLNSNDRRWMVVNLKRMGALNEDGQWIDPSNDYPRLFSDEEKAEFQLPEGADWQEFE